MTKSPVIPSLISDALKSLGLKRLAYRVDQVWLLNIHADFIQTGAAATAASWARTMPKVRALMFPQPFTAAN